MNEKYYVWGPNVRLAKTNGDRFLVDAGEDTYMIRYYCDKCGIEVNWPREGTISSILPGNHTQAKEDINATFGERQYMHLCNKCTSELCRWIKEEKTI